MNSHILIKPSNRLCKYVKEQNFEHLPTRLKAIIDNKAKTTMSETQPEQSYKLFTTKQDESFITSINNKLDENFMDTLINNSIETYSSKNSNDNYLQISDLIWLHHHLEKQRQQNGDRIYLHELLKDCVVCVPENEKIERNEELEKRCIYLKSQQENLKYKTMTKNVDNIRRREPEDSIAYQLKQLNKQLIAVFQFVVSILTGFVFGFMGIELIVGELEFGFKLLLGVMCALIVAVAELYFLAKQLVQI